MGSDFDRGEEAKHSDPAYLRSLTRRTSFAWGFGATARASIPDSRIIPSCLFSVRDENMAEHICTTYASVAYLICNACFTLDT
jgi:hypothetical protein